MYIIKLQGDIVMSSDLDFGKLVKEFVSELFLSQVDVIRPLLIRYDQTVQSWLAEAEKKIKFVYFESPGDREMERRESLREIMAIYFNYEDEGFGISEKHISKLETAYTWSGISKLFDLMSYETRVKFLKNLKTLHEIYGFKYK